MDPHSVENRPFSEPTSAADRPLNASAKVGFLPTAQQLTDVLNLLKHSPGEFQKLIQSVTSENEQSNDATGVTFAGDLSVKVNASVVSDTDMEATDSESSDSVTLENSVSVTEGDEVNDSEFIRVTAHTKRKQPMCASRIIYSILLGASTPNKNKKISNEELQGPRSICGLNSDSVHGNSATVDASADADAGTAIQLTVFVKGIGCNISKLIINRWTEFEREFTRRFGTPTSFRVAGQCLKVVCSTTRQKSQLMSCHDLLAHNISITEPYRLTKDKTSNRTQSSITKVVIRDVPTDMSDADIKQSIGYAWVKRITSWVDNQRKPSGVVILAFQGDTPKQVTVGPMLFKVSPYIPKPLRCTVCNSFGHHADRCRAKPTCVRCTSAEHTVESCPISDRAQYQCKNCGGAHSAAYRLCPKYIEIQATLKVAANKKISYSEAAKKVKADKATPGLIVQPTLGQQSKTGRPTTASESLNLSASLSFPNLEAKPSQAQPTMAKTSNSGESAPSLETIADVVCNIGVYIYGIIKHLCRICKLIGYDAGNLDTIGCTLFSKCTSVFGSKFQNKLKNPSNN